MNQQERVVLMWSVFFVVSGVFFIMAFMMSPAVGTFVTAAYIVLYIGLSAVFITVFREISELKTETAQTLSERKDELEEVEKALKAKYFRKKIDDEAYRKMTQEYEKLITEIEVKIERLKRKK